jgi:uncharacterized protein (UPF0332 family)
MLSVSLYAAAARTAYFAAFHAAQALIYEATGRVPKTHGGVQAEFARLTRDDASLAPEVRRFLSRGYEFKAAADYSTDEEPPVPESVAREAVDLAQRFRRWVEGEER